ncbi:DUF2312 domain-containing protein [Candidatus Cyrtobacter comes]|nr:DUF2312 domain-containing protein [Candidatus Cyrtobacter comes]
MSDIVVDGVSGSLLRQYIEKIERLELEKSEISQHIRDAYAAAKSEGFDIKIMRQIIKIRASDKHDIQEQETLLEVYKRALGMENDLDA